MNDTYRTTEAGRLSGPPARPFAPGPRDTLVTGWGFCLPGAGEEPVRTGKQVWETASTGTSHVERDGFHHGVVRGAREAFTELLPEMPTRYLRSYADVHLYGLVSLAEACADAGLDHRAGDLRHAAVLTARAGVDSNYDSYRAWHDADPATIGPADAKSLFVRLVVAGTSSDVGPVQAALLASTGASFTVSCGCASSSVLLGLARMMIADGSADLVVVTGVDRFDTERVLHGHRLREVVEREGVTVRHNSDPPADPRHDRPMRPYDAAGDCMNYGDGSVTLVLESREHAAARGARAHGALLGQATTRGGLGSAVAIDTEGIGLAEAARRSLGDHTSLDQVPYVNGGGEGDPLFTRIEANAVRRLWGDRSHEVLLSSQEACFGHSGAPLGNLGAALTLMMMRESQVCPTANCRTPSPVCTFDPVPGTLARPLSFSRALSFNYQVGGVNSALLLGGADVC
ncbi:beta-ketoacyl synthase N-terminal-like domain-containing protein [Streptomyces sp. NPDC002574]|uniref:beta-ketoacyl synthase N-terminal-like domain-containing protein n=1 Tax=Streptomyces sp. NPDC002574 TaxID=3364652 RepID=UPI0036A7F2A5